MARPRQIDRAGILKASLAIADDRGLDAVTMQAVADRLGVTPMALYRHVDNKADLLDGLVETLLAEFAEGTEDLPWDEQLAAFGRGVRATARRHPAVFGLVLQLPASTPEARATRDRVYAALRHLGVAEAEIPRTERLLSTMVLGFAASEAAGRFRGHSRAVIDGDYAVLEELLRSYLAGLTG